MSEPSVGHKLTAKAIQLCLQYYPKVQAIYLFGSWGTRDERSSSDMDIALLLPCGDAKEMGSLYDTAWHQMMERVWQKNVDGINLRQVSTVLQKEVIQAERRIYCANSYAADEFEMLTISYYQSLNAERADILHDFYNSTRAR